MIVTEERTTVAETEWAVSDLVFYTYETGSRYERKRKLGLRVNLNSHIIEGSNVTSLVNRCIYKMYGDEGVHIKARTILEREIRGMLRMAMKDFFA